MIVSIMKFVGTNYLCLQSQSWTNRDALNRRCWRTAYGKARCLHVKNPQITYKKILLLIASFLWGDYQHSLHYRSFLLGAASRRKSTVCITCAGTVLFTIFSRTANKNKSSFGDKLDFLMMFPPWSNQRGIRPKAVSISCPSGKTA